MAFVLLLGRAEVSGQTFMNPDHRARDPPACGQVENMGVTEADRQAPVSRRAGYASGAADALEPAAPASSRFTRSSRPPKRRAKSLTCWDATPGCATPNGLCRATSSLEVSSAQDTFWRDEWRGRWLLSDEAHHIGSPAPPPRYPDLTRSRQRAKTGLKQNPFWRAMAGIVRPTRPNRRRRPMRKSVLLPRR